MVERELLHELAREVVDEDVVVNQAGACELCARCHRNATAESGKRNELQNATCSKHALDAML